MATSDASDRIRRWSSAAEARASTTCVPSWCARRRAASIGGVAPATEVAAASIDNVSSAAAMRRPGPFHLLCVFSPTFPHRPATADA